MPNKYKYVLAYWDAGTTNYRHFEDVGSWEATETAKAWLKEHFPGPLERGEWSIDKED